MNRFGNFLCLVWLSTITGWALDANRPLLQASIDSWTHEEGLPLNSIYGLAQTPDGFLWLGSQDGLIRFDGTNFRVWRGGTDGLLGDILNYTLTDKQGRLWTGGRNGLFVQEKGRFRQVNLGDEPGRNAVLAISKSEDDVFWISTVAGSIRLRGDKVEALPEGMVIRRTAHTPDGRRSYLRTQAGLFIYEAGRLTPLGEKVRTIPEQVNEDGSLACDKDGRLWVASSVGLWRLDDDVFVHALAAPLPPISAKGLFFDRAGSLWMGGPAGGARYNLKTGRLERFSGPLSKLSIMRFLEDRDGNIWISTENDGLWRLRDGAFTTLDLPEGLPYPVVNALAQTSDGTFYAGTSEGGLYWRRDNESGVFSLQNGLLMPNVTALRAMPDGALWIGFPNGQLQELREGKFTTYGPADGLSSSSVLQLLVDRQARLWVGYQNGGLIRREPHGFVSMAKIPGAPSGMIASAYQDSAGALWFGTDRELVRFKDEKFQVFKAGDGLPMPLIAAITEGRQGEMWIGMGGRGVVRLRLHDEKLTPYPMESGLPVTIFAMIVDDAQRLWISSSDGVHCVALADIDAYEQGTLPTIPGLVFTLRDGLRSLVGRAIVGPTVLRTREGLIWFATNQGASAVDPQQTRKSSQPPVAFVTGLRVDDRPRAFEDEEEVKLAPGWKSLRFNYGAIELTASEKLGFDTRLEGYDSDWVEAGQRREATYTNLKPGKYVFRVRARRMDGEGEGAETGLALVVEPYFYQTPWFMGLGVVFGGVALFGAYLLRLHAIRAHNLMLERMVLERTRELQLVGADLAKANASKDRILAVIGHDLSGPASSLRALTQILAAKPDSFSHEELRLLAGEIDQACGVQMELLGNLLAWSRVQSDEWITDLQLLAPERLVGLTMDLVRLSAREKAIDLVSSVEATTLLYADETSIYTILRNLMGNALKFTPSGGRVSLTVISVGNEIGYIVEDTGVGISPERLERLWESFEIKVTRGTRAERGTGFGLPLSRDLARLNGGRLTVTSIQGQGTKVTLWLPAKAAV